MGRRSFVPGLAVVASALVVACASPLAEGVSEFRKGKYADAKTTLVASEGESRTWNDAARAEYALYRGLTHGALGDRAAASLWLREAKAIEDTRPGTLSRENAQRLVLGLESVEAGAPVSP